MDKEQFYQDLLKVQQGIPTIGYDETAKIPTKSGAQFEFKFASLNSIHKIIKPILNDNNFILSYEGKPGELSCCLYHTSGGVHQNSIEFKPLQDAKHTGALITYYKRYLLSALLAIDTEDDKDVSALNTKPKKKAVLTEKAYKQVQNRISGGDKEALKSCLLYFDLTDDQHQNLLNLDLEHNG